MIVVKTRKDIWAEDGMERDLIWEKCSNLDCPNGELHYPTFMTEPKCPDCKTQLIGFKLKEDMNYRLDYYLGAIV